MIINFFSEKKNLEILPPRVWPEKLDWKKPRKIEIGRLSVGESTDFWRPHWLPPNWTKIKNRKYKISSNQNQIDNFETISKIAKIKIFFTVLKMRKLQFFSMSHFSIPVQSIHRNWFFRDVNFLVTHSLTHRPSQLIRIWVWFLKII